MLLSRVAGVFDQDFWKIDLLQATRQYPAIWHAGLALAAMHRTMTSIPDLARRTRPNYYYLLALQHYNLSIKYLLRIAHQEQHTNADQETLLMASLLFMGLCCVQGDTRQTIIHAQNTLALFYHWRFWKHLEEPRHIGQQACVLRGSSLVTLITYVEGQFMHKLPYIQSPAWRGGLNPQKCSPKPFLSTTEAWSELVPLMNGMRDSWPLFEAPASIAQPHVDMYLAYRLEICNWISKYRSFYQQREPVYEQSDWESLVILRLYQLCLEIHTNVNTSESALMFDKHLAKFKHILVLLRELFEQKLSRDREGPREDLSPSFSFALSAGEILACIGKNCRDGAMRREATALLRCWRMKDGIWDGALSASITETVIRVEESGIEDRQLSVASDDDDYDDDDDDDGDDGDDDCKCIRNGFICADHRVLYHWIEFSEDGTAICYILTVRDVRQGKPARLARISY
ncbi:hypothetical protein QQS21_005960 [Conoideocrella luteorostrata]|uniref:Uncharacterized protein n=1 Tax=Conoideocrella luteorostrata TaxID=1105319 RepID=A0AAJ0CSN9_9HYPO|nr:hypothetical protein QQS21_005960 [Conoideocrella luteorostrata]